MDLKQIKDLIAYLEGTAFGEVEVEQEGLRVKVVRHARAPAAATPENPAAAPAQATESQAQAAGAYDVRIPEAPEAGKVIASPIVGTFYRAPAPDKPPYAEAGTLVKKGQVVCIVEAMKLMNEIESEFEGRVAAILVNDGDPVEFGQPLMRIES